MRLRKKRKELRSTSQSWEDHQMTPPIPLSHTLDLFTVVPLKSLASWVLISLQVFTSKPWQTLCFYVPIHSFGGMEISLH